MGEFSNLGPLKVLERSGRGELGKGNLGVLIAGAGLGKTSCLIHVAFDRLLRGEKLVHISLRDSPEKVASYYEIIFNELMKAQQKEQEEEVRNLLERNRIILAYLKESFDLERLKVNLENLIHGADFRPATLIVDGIDFTDARREFFEGLKELAGQFYVEVWLSALSSEEVSEEEKGVIPPPCSELADLFSIILQLISSHDGVFLRLLKDHEKDSVMGTEVRLDPNTFLVHE
jgi:KaiC/GvpD/RAD55 family RecA-like ATPase